MLARGQPPCIKKTGMSRCVVDRDRAFLGIVIRIWLQGVYIWYRVISEPLLNALQYRFEALAPFFHGCVGAVSVVSVAKFW